MNFSRVRHVLVVTALIIIAFILCLGIYHYVTRPDGSTVASREEMLDGVPKGSHWSIAEELEIDDYIISGAYDTEGNSAVVVFEPVGNGRYKLQTLTKKSSSEVILTSAYTANAIYDVAWFNGASTEYAEVTCTPQDSSSKTERYETQSNALVCRQVQEAEYTLHVAYYDADGNCYESLSR